MKSEEPKKSSFYIDFHIFWQDFSDTQISFENWQKKQNNEIGVSIRVMDSGQIF